MIPGGPPPMMLRGGPPLSQPGSGPPSARYTGGPMPMSAGPGGGGGSATSPRDGNEQRTGATVSYRFPWTSESFHPRRYYHRYQLESVTGNLSAQWTFQKEARFVASRVLRKVGKKMRLWVDTKRRVKAVMRLPRLTRALCFTQAISNHLRGGALLRAV